MRPQFEMPPGLHVQKASIEAMETCRIATIDAKAKVQLTFIALSVLEANSSMGADLTLLKKSAKVFGENILGPEIDFWRPQS